MNCSNCGYLLTPGATSCAQCGAQFSQPVPGVTQAKSKVPIWACAIGGCGCIPVIAILAAILFPVFAAAREKARQVGCASNIKQLGLAFQQYNEDYDMKMPPAGTWMDATYSYTKVELSCPDAAGQIGYAFNSNLNGKKISSLGDTSVRPTVYDSSTPGRNANDPMTSEPDPGRHRGGNNYGFADGHVDWLQTPPTP